jgi:hypothetical protein
VYGVVSVVMVLIVAAFALTARQAPPPSIAEFAPQSVEQIKQALAEQSSQFGSGANGNGTTATSSTTAPASLAGHGTTTTATQAPPIPAVHQCIGDPPRQIDDPQSPPCVPFFQGDNGGATAKGVTGNEIRIAVSSADWTAPLLPDLATFFNQHFEFYGRKINLVEVQSAGTSPDQQHATAQAMDAQSVFAAMGSAANGGFDVTEELARLKIVSTSLQPNYTQAAMVQRRPYVWQYPMGIDDEFANIGAWVCGRLAGENATHAGTSDGKDLTTVKRKFGVILDPNSPNQSVSWDPLLQQLGACGVQPVLVPGQNPEGGEGGDQLGQSAPMMLKMKDAGVTSIICLCFITDVGVWYSVAATQQQYFPEWILGTYLLGDRNVALAQPGIGPDATHRQHTFGLAFQPREVPLADAPDYRAVKEVDPGYTLGHDGFSLFLFYRELLLLASGIQMAGPRLTAQAFEAGLQHAVFPNPDSPLMEGKVGFANGSHSMTLDAAEWWWSNAGKAPNPFDPPGGAMCYVAGGARHSLGNWPKGGPDPLFGGACDSGG